MMTPRLHAVLGITFTLNSQRLRTFLISKSFSAAVAYYLTSGSVEWRSIL